MAQNKESLVQMDFIEKITLSPFEKYVRYGFFPWKFVLHLLLIALCTYQALKIVSIQDKHTRIQEQVFSTIYLQDEDGSSSFPYYSLSDFTSAFFSVVENTQSLNQTLLQYANVDDVNYELQIYYSDLSKENSDIMVVRGDSETFIDQLREQIGLEQNNSVRVKTFIQKVESMNLEMSNLITYISKDSQNRLNSCLNWTINIDYSFQSFANVESSLEAKSMECIVNESKVFVTESILSVHIAVMAVAAISLLLSWRQVYFVSKQYMYYQKNIHSNGRSEMGGESRFKSHLHWEKNWEELGFLDKLKFFDFWFLVIVTGNFFQLFGAFVAILDEGIDENLMIFQHKEILIGFGVMLAWITILKYLEYNSNLNLMSATLSKSWSNLFVFLIGVMPFFLGFVFLGQTIFWKYNKFQDTSSSVITLFSLLNGDIVNDTFLQTWAEGLVGQIYLIVFMILFYTAVQNVFVTIIMEGYEESIKEREHKRMIEEKQKKQRENFEKHLDQIQDQDSIVESPQLSPMQNQGISKIKRNGKKVDLILDEIDKVFEEVKESELSANEKMFLNNMLRENLESIGRNIKLQIKEIRKQK